MGSVPPLLTFLLLIVPGWVHHHQLIAIEFPRARLRASCRKNHREDKAADIVARFLGRRMERMLRIDPRLFSGQNYSARTIPPLDGS